MKINENDYIKAKNKLLIIEDKLNSNKLKQRDIIKKYNISRIKKTQYTLKDALNKIYSVRTLSKGKIVGGRINTPNILAGKFVKLVLVEVKK
jgi:hypothetical protein